MAIKKRKIKPRRDIRYRNLKKGDVVEDAVGHVYKVIFAGLRLREYVVEFEDITTKPKRNNMTIDSLQYNRCVLED